MFHMKKRKSFKKSVNEARNPMADDSYSGSQSVVLLQLHSSNDPYATPLSLSPPSLLFSLVCTLSAFHGSSLSLVRSSVVNCI